MDTLLRINYVLLWIFAILTGFGLYRPWLALWWRPITNRRMVLETYGLVALCLLIIYLLLFALR